VTRRFRLDAVAQRLEARGLLRGRRGGDAVLGGIAEDSRAVGAGDLFCAWKGSGADGHDFADAAVAAGAAGLLLERPLAADVPQLVVTDGRRAAAHAAALAFGDPADALTLVGVTGTNGKSTTVAIVRHLVGEGAASIGTLGARGEGGQPLLDSTLTTPGPVGIARTLAALVEKGIRTVAMEVSSHALDQGRADALRFDVAAFTNLSRDHLDYHGSESAYLEAKLRLLDLLGPQAIVVHNADEPAWEPIEKRHLRRLSFSATAASASVCAEDVMPHDDGTDFRLATPAGGWPVALPLLGAFNVENALAAATCALALGRPGREIAERLETVPQTPGRLERIAKTPCPVLRDYAHTPEALERVLEALRPVVAGRLIVVFGAGGDRDRGKRPEMGRAVQQGADIAIVTSDNPRTEDPERILDDITAGMDAGFLREVDRREAIRMALERARAGDLVLLAGKGHETYQVLGTESVPFDEQRVVAELLAGAAAEGVPAPAPPLAPNGGGEW
jgi:UDP-N-acetylmuramoyl-L-alanyl-D-glutamate--2,6-diaminopimelate ligase